MNFIGKRGNMGPGGVVLIILVLASGYYFITQGDGSTPTASVTGDGSTDGGDIIVTSGLTATFSAADNFDKTVSVLGNHEYRVAGQSTWQSVANGGTASLGPGQKIEFVAGVDNHTATASGVNYFASPPQVVTLGKVDQPISYNKLVKNGTVTVRAFNEQNVLISTSSTTTNVTMGADELLTVDGDIEMAADSGYPYGACAVLEFDGTRFDRSGMDFKYQGSSNSGITPSHYTASAAASQLKTFNLPAVTDNGRKKIEFILDSDATNNPGISHDVTLTLIPKDYYKNSDNGNYELGCEDEDGNAVGLMTSQTVYTIPLQ